MGLDLKLRAGPQRPVDGQGFVGRGGSQGEFVTSEMSGKHYEQTLRGNVFIYNVASQALLLTGSGVPTIINMSDSGKLFVPIVLRIGFISGTTTIGSVNIAGLKGVNSISTGAGSPILTATLVAAESANYNSGLASRMKFSPTTNTFTTAPSVIYATGINLGTAAPSVPGPYECKFDGTLVFPPGTSCSIVYSVTSSTSVFNITMIGLEIPLPLTI